MYSCRNMESPAIKTCHVCGAESASCCSQCKQTRYCNSKCQRADWVVHKKICGKPQLIHSLSSSGHRETITQPKMTAEYRKKLYDFKLQYIDQQRRNNPAWEEPDSDSPILSWERCYWESEHNKVGCDDEVPLDATVSLRSLREGVEEVSPFSIPTIFFT